MSHEPRSSGVLPSAGFTDATQDLLSTCSQLDLGQMVTMPGFTLMDSMSAIQIMDARMDSGMELPDDELPESERIPSSVKQVEFDPLQRLSACDVIWIMDRLLACEASWHLGRSLSQTIYTCLYFHDINRLSPHEAAFGNQYQTQASTSRMPSPSPPELVYLVLRAFIVATVKTCDLVWNELIKQNVYDGEDFSSDKSGLSLLEGMDSRSAVAHLEDALEWLSASEHLLDRAVYLSLRTRLSLRRAVLSAVALLHDRDPASLMDVSLQCRFARKHLDALRPPAGGSGSAPDGADLDGSSQIPSACLPLQDPSRRSAPSSRSMASFDPAYNRKLVANAPLRPVKLPSAEETGQFVDGLLRGLQQTVSLMQRPSVLRYKMFFSCQAFTFQDAQTLPYIRSLFQSAVCDRNLVAGRLPLDWLTQVFFSEVAQVDPLLLRRLTNVGLERPEGGYNAAWNAPPTIGQSVNYFSQRVAGHLVGYLSSLSQNRSRQKRTLSKTYAQWTALSEEASQLGKRIEAMLRPEDYMPDSLFAGLQHVALEVTLQVIMSGFELDLYRRDEWAGAYFVASRICSEQVLVCDELRRGVSESPSTLRGVRASSTANYLASQVELAHAFEAASIGTIMLLHATKPARGVAVPWPLPGPGSSTTTAEQHYRHEALLAKSTFTLRLKWLIIPNVKQSRQSIENLWDEFSAFQEQLATLDTPSVLAEAEANFLRAVQELERYAARSAEETKTELCDDTHRMITNNLQNTCRTNLAYIAERQAADVATPDTLPAPTAAPSIAFRPHRWFPTFTLASSSS